MACAFSLRNSSVYSPIIWPFSASPVAASGLKWNERPLKGMTAMREESSKSSVSLGTQRLSSTRQMPKSAGAMS